MSHKAGYINIVGLPNVGKSSLLNALLGQKLSATTPKAQTTRHRILGIVNGDDYQLVFSDTPGFINQPAYELHKRMNSFVEQALEDADVFLFVTDKYQKDEEQQHLIDFLNNTTVPVLVIINKADLYKEADMPALIEHWAKLIPKGEVLVISAEKGLNRDSFLKKISSLMPDSPAYFDKDQLSDRNVRFFVSEIIREKIFLNYQKEIPYSCEVEVNSYKEDEDIDRIKCTIYVERESQKAIILGKGGESIKKTGIDAREAIQSFVGGKKVHLELVVKVKDKWRNSENTLRNFGYES
ncbi:MAG: GTPase Era [Chitinophagales bacterium]